MPNDVSTRVGFFDKFAGGASLSAGRAVFFGGCVLLVIVGPPPILVLRDAAPWRLTITTATTIVTFLMVALLQNSQTRSDQAIQHKLNAIADGLADIMTHLADGHEERDLRVDIEELRAAVGLEERESTTNNARSQTAGDGR